MNIFLEKTDEQSHEKERLKIEIQSSLRIRHLPLFFITGFKPMPYYIPNNFRNLFEAVKLTP
jgi:hypothetical protein